MAVTRIIAIALCVTKKRRQANPFKNLNSLDIRGAIELIGSVLFELKIRINASRGD